MKKVMLYIRVSTDEQADKGYSQRHQDEVLTKYCDLKNMVPVAKYFEDHSAKTFDRPEFKKLLMILRKTKGGAAQQLLITKWDRFSRNAADAYQMIGLLRKLGVEVIAVEQPLDMSVPENKLMLAFFLAAPEVENDRRALNVKDGMMRAMKEGRFVYGAPIGYKNTTIDKFKTIVPSDKAKFIKYIFNALATQKYSVEAVLSEARKNGLHCSKNNFWNLVRNPVYAGYIKIPAYKGNPGILVKGQHEALVTPDLFYKVQDFIDGRKRKNEVTMKVRDKFPLRGFLECPRCGKSLTASTTVNRQKRKYSYYHCTSSCGERNKVEVVESALKNELKKLKPHPAVKILIELYVKEQVDKIRKEGRARTIKIKEELDAAQEKNDKALNLLLEEKIASDDYSRIKKQNEQLIVKLEAEMVEIATNTTNTSPQIEGCINVLDRLPELYEKSNADQRREILSSIFSEKLTFTGEGFRTLPLNEAMQLICSTGKALRENKKGQNEDDFNLSHLVNPMVLFSNTTIFQLRKIAALNFAA